MNKYTIFKSFERKFPFPIWKIEVDSKNELIAIETRDQDSTLPTFTVVNLEGEILLDNYLVDEKEWTLESIQKDYLILKRFGSSSPIQAGVKIIDINNKVITATHLEYIVRNVYQNQVLLNHRSIPSGLDYYLDLNTLQISTRKVELTNTESCVTLPQIYSGKIPKFLERIRYEVNIWFQPFHDKFLWSYHCINGDKFDLNLILSSRTEILDTKMILQGLDKLIPQPYFIVKDHIFFLSNNKMEITSYLVLL